METLKSNLDLIIILKKSIDSEYKLDEDKTIENTLIESHNYLMDADPEYDGCLVGLDDRSFEYRFLNLLSKAINLSYEKNIGFKISLSSSLEDVLLEAEDFLKNNATCEECYCEVHSGGWGQYYNYSDNSGYQKDCTGDIIDLYCLDEGEKIFFETIVNNNGDVIKLYELAR